MSVLLVAILNDPGHIWAVLDAWAALGVGDATIFDSTGRHAAGSFRDDLPLFPSVQDLLETTEAHHRTLWSVVSDDTDLDALARATEAVVGPLDKPATGLLFAIPVIKTWGLRRPGSG